jgi:hypothetical protein
MSTELATWRPRVLATAEAFYQRDVVDGTVQGNRIIGVEIIGGATGSPDYAYQNRKTAWCGFFGQCCYRAAGFNLAECLASAGRVVEVFGFYRHEAMAGAPAWALDTRTGAIEHIQDLHRKLEAARRVWKGAAHALPGDLVVYRKKDSWNGHVMLAWSVDVGAGEITVIEGNHSKAVGPTGKRRDGVGKRVLKLDDPYLGFTVRPSDLDFDPAYRYFASRLQAEKQRAVLLASGGLHG